MMVTVMMINYDDDDDDDVNTVEGNVVSDPVSSVL
jgi:hypothetical protein